MKRCLLIIALLVFTGCGTKKTQEWIDQLKDTDASKRLEALRALENRNSEASVVVPALQGLLQDESAYLRRDAAKALGKIGPEAKAAIPALVALLDDKDRRVHNAVADALKKIDPEAAAKVGIR